MFERYAIFYTPTGPLADFGAQWLGWDNANGVAVAHLEIAGLDVDKLTARPRKYGLHGTLKAPFRLAATVSQPDLEQAAADFAARYGGVELQNLELRHDNGFIALRPQNNPAALRDFAAATVKAFDPLRAPLSDADIARRRKARLTTRQDQQMLEWGYPFIFDDFHFHLTLTGGLPKTDAATVIAALQPHVDALVPKPFFIDAITLMGQDETGMFHQINRYRLSG